MSAMVENAIQNLVRLLETDAPSWQYGLEHAFWRCCLEVIQPMPGSTLKLREIATKDDKEQLLDTLAEVKYAVIFSELGFQVEIEPLKNNRRGSNPDLRISKEGHSALAEVKRFRPSVNPAPELGEASILSEYGAPIRDLKKLFDEVEAKFRQAGSEGIIALWNNNDNLESIEVESAVHAHALQANPKRASFLLLRSYIDDENLSCYKLRYRLPAHQEVWMTELEQVNPRQVLLGSYLRRTKTQQSRL
jgi:hypothetical protein